MLFDDLQIQAGEMTEQVLPEESEACSSAGDRSVKYICQILAISAQCMFTDALQFFKCQWTHEHVHLFATCEIYPRSSAFTHVGDQSWARAVCSSESIPSHSCLSICPPVWGRSWWCERRPHFAPAPNIPCSADMTKMISYLTRLVSWMLVIWQVTQGSREREVCLQMLPPCWILIHCNALLVLLLAQRIPLVWCWSFQLLEY